MHNKSTDSSVRRLTPGEHKCYEAAREDLVLKTHQLFVMMLLLLPIIIKRETRKKTMSFEIFNETYFMFTKTKWLSLFSVVQISEFYSPMI